MTRPLADSEIWDLLWPRLRKIIEDQHFSGRWSIDIPADLPKRIADLFLQDKYDDIDALWLDFMKREIPQGTIAVSDTMTE